MNKEGSLVKKTTLGEVGVKLAPMDFTKHNEDLAELSRYVSMFDEIRMKAQRLFDSEFIDIKIDEAATEATGGAVTIYKLPEGHQILLEAGRALYARTKNININITHDISPVSGGIVETPNV